jgi:hypothetical protein
MTGVGALAWVGGKIRCAKRDDAGERRKSKAEERFLRCVSRLFRRSETEEKASAYFGRNDWAGCVDWVSGKIKCDKRQS